MKQTDVPCKAKKASFLNIVHVRTCQIQTICAYSIDSMTTSLATIYYVKLLIPIVFIER